MMNRRPFFNQKALRHVGFFAILVLLLSYGFHPVEHTDVKHDSMSSECQICCFHQAPEHPFEAPAPHYEPEPEKTLSLSDKNYLPQRSYPRSLPERGPPSA